MLCAGIVRAQTPQQQAAKFVSEMSGKLLNGEATEADMQACRNLYDNIGDETVKQRLLLYAAQYQRLYKSSPKKSLEILMPQLLDKDALKKWRAEGGDPPRSLLWGIRDENALAALEVAQCLTALENTEFALEIVDDIGKRYTDETRAFAAGCAGDIYNALSDFSKAIECYKLGDDVLQGVGRKDYYYAKSGVALVKEEVNALRKWMSDKQKVAVGQVAEKKGKNADVRLNLSEWKGPPPKVDRLDIKAEFIICMIPDGEGGAFVGTEDHGVHHYDNLGNVKQYTDKDGMGDPNAYALAIDKKGRLWTGNLNTGVSVFNGKEWRNYDVVDGPIGERIFDIQTCPVDGDVWIATSAGITRYKIDTDEWEHFTREDGLLEDQASSLAFKNDGTLIVGTQCHGLAVFNRSQNGDYKHAKNITAPERYGPGNCSPVPLVPYGDGLPTNQINQIIVAQNGTIWIATPTGLVKSNGNLAQIQYVRGRDYADKVRGLYGGAPKEWKECPKEIMEQLLPEDYITCLAEDNTGTIWIGTRLKGFMAIDPKTGRRGTGDRASMGMADNYVSAILPMADDMPLIGLYIGGVIKPKSELKLKTAGKPKAGRTVYSVAKKEFAPLPSPIKPPTIDELKAMQAKLEKLNKPLPKTYAAYYGEDWKTQGDWVGRTFRDWAVLCAVTAPFDHPVYFTTEFYSVHEFIGPNYREKNDTIRRWIHWIKTDNPKTLYDPWYGYRRQAEWDDHGEVYPLTMDGPDLWYMLRIRNAGAFRIGMYFFNKDGHAGHNRLRDYMLEIYPALPDEKMEEWPQYKFSDWQKYSVLAESLVRNSAPLAKSRMHDFWGGVHKQFVVTGSGYYFVKVKRNYSFNTILSSVSVDRLDGEPTRDERYGIPLQCEIPYEAPPLPKSYSSGTGMRVGLLWRTLNDKYGTKDNIQLQRLMRLAVYQAAREFGQDDAEIAELARSLKWRLNLWDDTQRQEWHQAMKRAHNALLQSVPTLRQAIEQYEK